MAEASFAGIEAYLRKREADLSAVGAHVRFGRAEVRVGRADVRVRRADVRVGHAHIHVDDTDVRVGRADVSVDDTHVRFASFGERNGSFAAYSPIGGESSPDAAFSRSFCAASVRCSGVRMGNTAAATLVK